MAAIKFMARQAFDALGEGKPVPEPLGVPVSHVRSMSQPSSSAAGTRCGVWECTPGRWRRQITQAEFCHFLEGDCTFEPEDGEPVVINGGDVIYFPENSLGVWDVRETCRKIFILFDESATA
ncbi:cupin domain-containing protein [Sphingobium ummariense]|uniref:(S)-ureidoglycine aminohydrolase cupin domain-containing protein n=1 Tax=Sphingobium ummariense RL-3 TaxID=1346791 RepID=T0K697_9SPHN|nr:cupin domain-containing protein [Sphingobium ummariense]EQB32184.1 hypothetical protein M529_10300 [Sphingobium ummariense RL-3]